MFDSKKYRESNIEKIKEYQAKWRQNNPGYHKKWEGLNRGYHKAYNREYYSDSNNKTRQKSHQRKWAKSNREKVKNYRKQPLPKLSMLMRIHIRRILNYTNAKKVNKLDDYIGCTPYELKLHLESQFKSGMAWNNHGLWHIDHIKPLSSFSEQEILKANHFTNLQPLWANENLSKQNKVLNNIIDEQ